MRKLTAQTTEGYRIAAMRRFLVIQALFARKEFRAFPQDSRGAISAARAYWSTRNLIHDWHFCFDTSPSETARRAEARSRKARKAV